MRDRARAERWAELSKTMTMATIAAREGVTRERVRQVLKTMGITARDVAPIRCTNCGERCDPRGRRRMYCSKPDCHRAASREYQRRRSVTAQLPRAVCAECGAVLKRPARPGGAPSYCSDRKPCLAAKQRWLYRNNPTIRAYVLEYGKSDRAKAVRKAWTKTPKGQEYLRRQLEKLRALPKKPRVQSAEVIERQNRRRAERAAQRAAAGQELQARLLRAAVMRQKANEHAAQAFTLRNQGLSERAIASRLGVSRSTVNGWLLGTRRPSVKAHTQEAA